MIRTIVRQWLAKTRPATAVLDSGYVTAEFAMLLPGLVAVFVLFAGALGLLAKQVNLQIQAGHAVRLLSRGDQLDDAWRAKLPAQTQLNIQREAEQITVVLTLPGVVDLQAKASAFDESN